jgi:hypothetical protein
MMPNHIAILSSLLVGLAATLGTIVIHGFVVHTIVMTLRSNLQRGVLGVRISRSPISARPFIHADTLGYTNTSGARQGTVKGLLKKAKAFSTDGMGADGREAIWRPRAALDRVPNLPLRVT